MNNPVAWFEIYVDDMKRAKAFYERVFEVHLSKVDSPEAELWMFPMLGGAAGASGALVHMPGFAAGRNSVLVYFSCVDCAVESAKAVAAGGRIQKQKFSIGEFGFLALVIDSEGNMIGLHSMS